MTQTCLSASTTMCTSKDWPRVSVRVPVVQAGSKNLCTCDSWENRKLFLPPPPVSQDARPTARGKLSAAERKAKAPKPGRLQLKAHGLIKGLADVLQSVGSEKADPNEESASNFEWESEEEEKGAHRARASAARKGGGQEEQGKKKKKTQKRKSKGRLTGQAPKKAKKKSRTTEACGNVASFEFS